MEYSLRAIPLGGYVAFPDDDPESKFDPEDPDLLKNRSIPQRALVISAGVIANVIFAMSLLLTQVIYVCLPHFSYDIHAFCPFSLAKMVQECQEYHTTEV